MILGTVVALAAVRHAWQELTGGKMCRVWEGATDPVSRQFATIDRGTRVASGSPDNGAGEHVSRWRQRLRELVELAGSVHAKFNGREYDHHHVRKRVQWRSRHRLGFHEQSVSLHAGAFQRSAVDAHAACQRLRLDDLVVDHRRDKFH